METLSFLLHAFFCNPKDTGPLGRNKQILNTIPHKNIRMGRYRERERARYIGRESKRETYSERGRE